MANPLNTRITVAALTLSAAAFVGILTREGYTDQAVIPVRGDVPTNGFGTTEGVKLGDRTTPVKAVQRALTDVSKYEGALKRCVKVPLHQAEYDLYINLSYNIGGTGFCTSTIVKRLNAMNYRGACDAILMWKYGPRQFDCSTPGNKVCAGLWADRLKVHQQCLAAQ
jgi:lysozyme